MRNIILITETRIKLMMRHKILLILCIALPVIFYFLVGQIFSKSEYTSKVPIVVIDEGQSATSKDIVERLKNNDALNCIFTTKDKALSLLEESKVEGVYIFKKDLENNIKGGNLKNLVDVYYLPQNTAAVGITDVVSGEMISVICNDKAAAVGKELYNKYKMNNKESVYKDIVNLAKELETDPDFKLPVNIKTMDSKTSSTSQNNVDRSTIAKKAALGMIIIFTTLFIFSNYASFMKERASNVSLRIKATGVSNLQVLAADILGLVITGMAVGIIQMAVLYPAFKINSSTVILEVLYIYIIYIFCISSMLVLFTNIFKNIVSLQGFVPIFTFFMGLISGCLLGIELIPKNIRFISCLMPAYYMNDAMTKAVLYNYGFNSTVIDGVVLLISSICIFSVTYILSRREKL